MTTTPELHELARDPQAFDTALARLHGNRDHHSATLNAATAKLHELAGDRKSYRVPVWGMTDLEVERDAQRKTAHGDPLAASVLTQRAGFRALVDADDFEIANMDAVYNRQGNRWTRFFPSITKSQPHIHRSLSCSTLYPTTIMRWEPSLSGKTDDEAVAKLDESLCSVCFKDAPVRLREHVSTRTTAEQDARQAEKQARADAKAVKTLTEAEQFRTTGRFSDRITTVAACKELIRKAVEADVELEWILQDERITDKGMTADMLERMRVNRRDRLVEAQADAEHARAVLRAREAAHEGWGATEDAIEEMIARKLKSARKDWFKN